MTLFVIVKLSARENVSSLRISELVPYRVMDTAAVREVVPIFSREVMIGRVNQSLPQSSAFWTPGVHALNFSRLVSTFGGFLYAMCTFA